jgi:hypothetical protein
LLQNGLKERFNELKQPRIYLFCYFLVLLVFSIYIVINAWVPTGETVKTENSTRPFSKSPVKGTNITVPVLGPIDKPVGSSPTNITVPAAGAKVTTTTTTSQNSTTETINIKNILTVKDRIYLLNQTEKTTPKNITVLLEKILPLRSQNKEIRLVSLSALFGFVGACLSGITSVLTRKVWTNSKHGTAVRLVYVYFARPWVGTAVAIVTYIALRAGLVNMGSAADVKILSDFGIAAISALVGLMSDEMILRLRDVFRAFFGLTTLQGTQELIVSLPKTNIVKGEKIPISATLAEARSIQDLSAYFFVDDEKIAKLDKKEEKFNDSGVSIVDITAIAIGTTVVSVIVRNGLDLYVSREITVVDGGAAGDGDQVKSKSDKN